MEGHGDESIGRAWTPGFAGRIGEEKDREDEGPTPSLRALVFSTLLLTVGRQRRPPRPALRERSDPSPVSRGNFLPVTEEAAQALLQCQLIEIE